MSQPTPDRIMEVGLGFWSSKTLLSAIELGLFTELARQPGDLASVRSRLGLHPRSASDFLDALRLLRVDEASGVPRNARGTPGRARFDGGGDEMIHLLI